MLLALCAGCFGGWLMSLNHVRSQPISDEGFYRMELKRLAGPALGQSLVPRCTLDRAALYMAAALPAAPAEVRAGKQLHHDVMWWY
jgi:hypothetical protein